MKKLVLTFDDGPDSRYTKKFIDYLDDEKVRATFFVVARNAEQNPELVKRMKQEGFCVGLHSLEHKHAYLCSYRYMEYDFNISMQIMKRLGFNIVFYRPPWGKSNLFTHRFLHRYHLKPVLWDIMVGDWKAGVTSEMIARRIEQRVFDGAIICLHDSGEKSGGARGAPLRTLEALKIVIPRLRMRGYEFITVQEFYQQCKYHLPMLMKQNNKIRD